MLSSTDLARQKQSKYVIDYKKKPNRDKPAKCLNEESLHVLFVLMVMKFSHIKGTFHGIVKHKDKQKHILEEHKHIWT